MPHQAYLQVDEHSRSFTSLKPGIQFSQRNSVNGDPLTLDATPGMSPPEPRGPHENHQFIRQAGTAGAGPERLESISEMAGLLLELPGSCLERGFRTLVTNQPRWKLDHRTAGRGPVLLDQQQLSRVGDRDHADHVPRGRPTDVFPSALLEETQVRSRVEGPGVGGVLVIGHGQAFPVEWDRAHRSGTVAFAMTDGSMKSSMKPSPDELDRGSLNHGTNSRLTPFGTTIFTTISHRAAAADAINLGQGFPDEDPPEALIQATIASLNAGHNQYAPMTGLPELRQAIANDQARRDRCSWCADSEVTVTSGATGALAASLLGTLEIDDEVILFDPCYDAYPSLVAMAGAHAKRLAPDAPDFRITRALIDPAITPRTRMIVLNTPWNPTGRVLDDAELQAVADCCIENNLICVSDEVYERLVFTRPHRSIASLPGMRDRTIVISSMGKTYSCTGWKVGWACATETLSSAIRAAHQFLVFSIPSPLQKAATRALNDFGNDWDQQLLESYAARRELLFDGLTAAGLQPIAPEGTYFILADFSSLGDADDHAFCDRLLETVGIAAIPTSVFTEGGGGMRSMARFAFCKPLPLLEEALARLARLSPLTPGDVR